jgi:hypothetical protein
MANLTAADRTPEPVELRIAVDPKQSRRDWLVLRGRGVLDRRALATGKWASSLDPTIRLELAVHARRVAVHPFSTLGSAPCGKAAIAVGLGLGLFFIVRAVAEPFVIDVSGPATYRNDWGGPSLLGVLLVHCGPGVMAAVAIATVLIRRRSSGRAQTE